MATRHLGYAPYAASNWCFVKNTDVNRSLKNNPAEIIIILFDGKLWEILTYIIVTVLFILISAHIAKVHLLAFLHWSYLFPVRLMHTGVRSIGWYWGGSHNIMTLVTTSYNTTIVLYLVGLCRERERGGEEQRKGEREKVKVIIAYTHTLTNHPRRLGNR